LNVTERRLRLRSNHYSPIPLYGKNPGVCDRWQWQTKHDASIEEIEHWQVSFPDARNTGLLTKFCPAFDIDILHAEAVRAIEDLVRERFADFGRILVRRGRAPKAAVLFRTSEPFRKITRLFTAPEGFAPEDRDQRLEFLADGQQIVAYGEHPDTGRPYEWIGGSPDNVPIDQLPDITADAAKDVAAAAARILVDQFGYKPKISSIGLDDCGGEHVAGEAQAPARLIERALAVIPNDGGWDEWNRIGMAIFAGTGGSEAGFQLFDEWSGRSRCD
jgi:hypothetical protein